MVWKWVEVERTMAYLLWIGIETPALDLYPRWHPGPAHTQGCYRPWTGPGKSSAFLPCQWGHWLRGQRDLPKVTHIICRARTRTQAFWLALFSFCLVCNLQFILPVDLFCQVYSPDLNPLGQVKQMNSAPQGLRWGILSVALGSLVLFLYTNDAKKLQNSGLLFSSLTDWQSQGEHPGECRVTKSDLQKPTSSASHSRTGPKEMGVFQRPGGRSYWVISITRGLACVQRLVHYISGLEGFNLL